MKIRLADELALRPQRLLSLRVDAIRARKLQRVDDLIWSQHSFLDEDDVCLFLREYTAGAGYAHGDTNNLISNLKKKLDRRGRSEWFYKEQAIEKVGQELRQVLQNTLEKNRDRLTVVPMPPSLTKSNAMYDDRMRRIVDVMTRGLGSDVRELVVQTRDMQPAHLVPSGTPRRARARATGTPSTRSTSSSPSRSRETSWSSTTC